MISDALRPRALPPISYPAWVRTREALAAAIATGDGLVCLVGRSGSGKTYTLKLYSLSVQGRRVGYRLSDTAVETQLDIDIVDSVNKSTVENLSSYSLPNTVRVISLLPELLDLALHIQPEARVVWMQAMEKSDVEYMVIERCKHLGLEREKLSDEALTAFVQESDGTPRQLDRTIGGALRCAFNDGVENITANHVAKKLCGISTQADLNRPSAESEVVTKITADMLYDIPMFIDTIKKQSSSKAQDSIKPSFNTTLVSESALETAPQTFCNPDPRPVFTTHLENGSKSKPFLDFLTQQQCLPNMIWAADLQEKNASPINKLHPAEAKAIDKIKWQNPINIGFFSAAVIAATLLPMLTMPNAISNMKLFATIDRTKTQLERHSSSTLSTLHSKLSSEHTAGMNHVVLNVTPWLEDKLDRQFQALDPVQFAVMQDHKNLLAKFSSFDIKTTPTIHPDLPLIVSITEASTSPKSPASETQIGREKSVYLLQLAKIMQLIGQKGDAQELIQASASMGNPEAKQVLSQEIGP